MENKNKDNTFPLLHPATVSLVETKMLENEDFEKAVKFFKAIGDGTRMKILWALNIHEMCVGDLCYITSMSKSAVSHQLKVLRDANLVTSRKEGKIVFYHLSDDHVKIMLESGMEHVFEKK